MLVTLMNYISNPHRSLEPSIPFVQRFACMCVSLLCGIWWGCPWTHSLLTLTSGGRHQCTTQCGTRGILEDLAAYIAGPVQIS